MESVELVVEPHHMGFKAIETRLDLLQSDIDPVEPEIESVTQGGEVGLCRQVGFGWHMAHESHGVFWTEYLLKSSIQGISLCKAGHLRFLLFMSSVVNVRSGCDRSQKSS